MMKVITATDVWCGNYEGVRHALVDEATSNHAVRRAGRSAVSVAFGDEGIGTSDGEALRIVKDELAGDVRDARRDAIVSRVDVILRAACVG